ncbi:scarecrow-like protein 34 [Panicum miliaceum]|uniref:Scarecrow-like protein 34 n=1 Tax=Panicum miliaceum TaxID=4540 RepID=A0A3L6Q3R8_PANMI|nr:scarecrow-like protein 34 [Panicum miliaceum]
MSATPEGFLGQGAYLAAPEPFSPSVFLDLPPTPRPDADDDPASSDDLVLPFISRMLMEEDIDDKFFYQFPDHPALLSAQQPYAQILLSDESATNSTSNSSSGAGTAASSTLSPSSSSDAPASAEPAWPYDPIELSQLLRSPPYPDTALGLHDFTADDVDALLLQGQGEATAGFHHSPPFLDTGGGGGAGGGQRQGAAAQNAAGEGSPPLAAQNAGRGAGIQRSAADEQDTKTTNATTLPAADSDPAALASAFFSGQSGESMDMLNMAFLKGMEEAKKFLPTNDGLLINLQDTSSGQSLPRDSTPGTGFPAAQVKEEVAAGGMLLFGGSTAGRGRKNRHTDEDLEAETGRNSKLMMPEQEETGAGELFDELMSCNYDGFLKHMNDLRIAMDSESEKSARRVSGKGARGRQRANEVVDLRTMLIHCAQSVATGDRRSATDLLRHIKQHSSPRGDATQRMAHCFAEGLEARLAGTGSQVYQSLMAKRTSVVEFLKAYKLFMAASSLKKVHIMFANQTILDAVAGRSKLHIVVYGVQYGLQWPGLLHFLARREGGPPEVRFTGIDLPQPGFRPAYQIEETGRRLSNCALEFGVPFKFQGIAAKWETVCAEDLNIDPDEVLVVHSECDFSKLMDESVDVDTPSPRDVVLNNIRKMRPNVFILFVMNGTYGAPFFLTRFREALFFYSALFDMLDATIPRDNDERLLIERDIFGRSALNVIACEGADRVERPETYKQWQVRNHRAGLKQLPLNPGVVKIVRDKVKNYYHKDFLIDEDHRWLLQGWKGRVLYAMSTWVAEDNNIF